MNNTLGTMAVGIRRRRAWPALTASGFAVAAMLTVSACAEMEPGQRGAATGAAIGSGIALVSGASAGAVIGAGLIGGGVGYVGGTAAGGR